MDSRLRPFGLLFNKSLNDMIRGMRKRKDPELLADYLRQTIAECREEAKNPDVDIKAMAILKLAYLEMYGFDMTWAGFNVLEVMSSPKFQQKRIGYLASIKMFRDEELLMMATNLLKNDLSSSEMPRVAIALSGLASIVTPPLAQDISEDIVKMLNHSKPYIRKKALLAMYKVVLQYPQVFDTFVHKIKDRLEAEDEDPSVISAAVSVLCELANQADSRKFIELAPSLYDLLQTSKNNWCLIKILKLFSRLCRTEPRLKNRVRPAVVELMESTDAMSLQYECINCILRGGLLDDDDVALAAKCTSRIRYLMQEHDQNLKYVALVALDQLLSINPDYLANESSLVIDAIDDSDVSIRRRALCMLSPLVNDDNLYDIVQHLMEQLRSQENTPEYNLQLARTVTELCNHNNYEYLPNFEWFIEILVELMILTHSIEGADDVVGRQLQNVAIRVKSERANVVAAAVNLSLNQEIVKKQTNLTSYTMWIIGEYIGEYFTSANATTGPEFIRNLLKIRPSPITVPAIAKIFTAWIQTLSYWSGKQAQIVGEVVEDITTYLTGLSVSANTEIQERAAQFLELFKLGSDALEESGADSEHAPALLTVGFTSLFQNYELKPIAANAQRRIAVPADLDLDTPVKLPEISWSGSEGGFSDDEPEDALPPTTDTSRDKQSSLFYIPTQSSSQVSDESRSTSSLGTAEGVADVESDSSRVPSSTPPPMRPKRVQKKKIEIAQDEALDLPEKSPEKAKPVQKKTPLFQMGNRLHALELSETPEPVSDEVKVKHKTKSKKKKKSKDKEPKAET